MLSNRHTTNSCLLTKSIHLIQTQISCYVTETSSTQNDYSQESGEKC